MTGSSDQRLGSQCHLSRGSTTELSKSSRRYFSATGGFSKWVEAPPSNRDRGRPYDLTPPTPPDIRVTNTVVRLLQQARACPDVGGWLPTAACRPVGHPAVQALRGEPGRPFRPSASPPVLYRLLTPPMGSAMMTHLSATFRGPREASRGQLSYRQCLDAGCIKHSPLVDGGLRGRVPARPDRTTPPIRFVSLAPHLRSTLPSDAPLTRTPWRFPSPSAPRTPGQGTFTPEHDSMHGTHAIKLSRWRFLPVGCSAC